MSMNVNLKSTVGGIFESIQIIRPDGSVRHELGPFPNLITDDGLDMIGELSDWLTHLKLGTGTTPPAFTDTELENQVALVTGGSSSSSVYTSAPYGAYATRTWLSNPFSSPAILGELGIGTSSRLFSRTLIKDSEGEPTTIEVLEGEMVRVSYRFNYYAPVDDTTGTTEMDFEGVPTMVSWVARASRVTSGSTTTGWNTPRTSDLVNSTSSALGPFPGEIGDVTSSPSGSSGSTNGASVSNRPYEPGSYTAESSITLGPTLGNVSGNSIRSYGWRHGCGIYQIEFDPPIPKSSTKTLRLTFSHSWGRA